MRSYGQYCSIAKALDVLGDRWTLLIVRELWLKGACRYTDLLTDLPGISSNLLVDRLRELEQAGVVSRAAAPPPVATTLFQLTAWGAELEPVLRAIGRWGERLMEQPTGHEDFRSHWLVFPVWNSSPTPRRAGRRSASCSTPATSQSPSTSRTTRSELESGPRRRPTWCSPDPRQ